MDETGTTTVQVLDKIIAIKRQRQVGAVTSAERGTLVTVAFPANSQGNFVPPYFIFPRKKFQHHFIRDGPLGCTGSANGSGWMQETDFLAFLQHFARHTRVTSESKVLLLFNNHPSHLSVVAIDFCKSHGIVLLSFPSHCSHRLQPLDQNVFGPLKHYINSAADNWMRMNPGRTLTIYSIPSLVAKALPQASTASSISSEFECTGIWSLNPDIFSETDFAPAYVTDHPAPAPAPSPMPVPAPSPAPSSSPMSASSPAPSSSPMSASSPAPSSSPMSASSPAPSSSPMSASSPAPSSSPMSASSPAPSSSPMSASSPVPSSSPMSASSPAPSSSPMSASSPAPSSSPMSASSPAPSSSPMSASSPAPSSSPMSAPSPALAPLRHQRPSQGSFELHPHESAIPLDGMLVVPGTSIGTPIQRFSPEKVRPYPKAGSRKENKRRGRKRSTAILTDTPVKAALQEETRQRGKKKQSSSKHPKKTLLSGYTATTVSRGNEEECLVCGEAFASSLPGEVWVQCIFCLLWSGGMH